MLIEICSEVIESSIAMNRYNIRVTILFLLAITLIVTPIGFALVIRVPVVTFFTGYDPTLTRITESIEDKHSDVDYVIALSNWVHTRIKHLSNMPNTKPTIYEVIDRGWGFCHESSKVLVALLMERGYPARRLSLHHTDGVHGHVVVETYVDGKWIILDPDHGKYYQLDNGSLANAMELDENWNKNYGEKMADYYHEFTVIERFGRDLKGVLLRRLLQSSIEYSIDSRTYLYDDTFRWTVWRVVPTYVITVIYYLISGMIIYVFKRLLIRYPS